MKKILILRHAKAQDLTATQTDFERPLHKRGIEEALSMGKILKEKGLDIQKWCVSPAQRTRETAKYITHILDVNTEKIQFIPQIYEAEVEILIQIIQNLSNHIDFVAIIGHNPSVSGVLEYLLTHYWANLNTCEAVCIELNIAHWQEVHQGSATLLWKEIP